MLKWIGTTIEYVAIFLLAGFLTGGDRALTLIAGLLMIIVLKMSRNKGA